MAEEKSKKGKQKDSEVPNSEKIIELHAQGLTQKEIAKEIGVAQSTVHYYMKRLELEPNYKYPYAKKEDKEVKKIISEDTRELIKDAVPHASALEELKNETQKNVEELKEILPKSILSQDDLPINYELVDGTTETLTPQQYYELAKLTLELLKTIWEG